MKDYSTPVEGILKREADGTIASQEVVEVELVDLAAVATSGNYNDLTNKPTIPANTDTLGKNIVGTSATASSNGAVSGTGGVYLNHIEGTNTVKSTHKIVGSGATTVKSDANGNITISTPATDISKLQPKITANGFLKSDGSGNITADKPALCVEIGEAQDGTITANKTPEEIYEAYSNGYAVYATYGDWDEEFILPLKIAYPHMTAFFGVFQSGANEIVFGLVGNTGNGWIKEEMSVPLTDKVVPTTRTINSKPLSSDITLTADDVNAVGLTGDQTIGGDKTFKGNIIFTDDDNIAAEVTFVTNATFQHASTVAFNGARVFFDESTEVDFTNATITGLHGLLPSVGLLDNGKFLRVVNGAWTAATVENANGVSF